MEGLADMLQIGQARAGIAQAGATTAKTQMETAQMPGAADLNRRKIEADIQARGVAAARGQIISPGAGYIPPGARQSTFTHPATPTRPEATPDAIQIYELYAEQTKAAGQTPKSIEEFQSGPAETQRRFTAEQNALNRASRLEAARVAAGSRPATSAALRVASFYYRMEDALNTIESKPGGAPSLEEQIASLGTGGQLALQYLPNLFQSQTGQLYRQAQRQFTEARLRKDSGAAIRDEEYAADALIYFARPGDTKETLARKRNARQKVLAAIKHEAGKAVETEAPAPAAPTRPPNVPPNAVWNGQYWVEE